MSFSLSTALIIKGKAMFRRGFSTGLALLLPGALTLGGTALLQRMRAAAQTKTQAPTQQDRELAALIRQLTNRSSEGLMETKLPEGGYQLDLKGRFQQVPLTRRNADGSLTVACVESLEEANAFFGRNLETGEPEPARQTANQDENTREAAQLGISPAERRFYKRLIEEAAQRRKFAPNAATITIQNGDGAGEGFNDGAARAPEGGNNGLTLGQQRLNLFNAAAAVWSAFLDSNVATVVNAQFNSLTPCGNGSGVLGSAGTNLIFRDFTNAPFSGTWYHFALANKLAGSDLNAAHEINATFNSDIDTGCLAPGTRFYYGLDNTTPANTINLFVVLLHELGHGLGFSSFVNGATGQLNSGFPDIYTRFMFDRTVNKYWHQMTNAERFTSARNNGNVLWDGPSVRLGSDNLTGGRDAVTGRVQLYTPTTFSGGSSISHYDTACAPNLLMEPFINAGLSLDLDLTRQQMRDIGWYRDTTTDLAADTITNVMPNAGSVTGGTNANITWTNTGGFNRNVTLELSTDGGTSFPTSIASNIANTGSFIWTVPNTPTTQARVRVREHNFAVPAGASSANFTIVISCPAIAVNPTTTGPGTAGTAFNQTFTQTGGTAPIDWSFTGTLPAGLSLNSTTGALTGTPTQAGSFNFTIVATDTNLCTGNRPYTLTINCPTVTLSPTSLNNGTLGTAYNQSVTASPSSTYNYAVSAGALPAGLSLNASTGALTGTPTAQGTSNFTITATGFGSCPGSRAYSITINCQSLTVNPTALASGFIGVTYNQVFTQTGGYGTTNFNLTGTLPTGVSFTPATATLAGTPTQSGSFPITVTATDANGCTGTRNYTLVINNCPTINLSPASLSGGTLNVAYSQQLTASGGVGSYSYNLSAGNLPGGLTLSATGLLTGTPTQNGTFNFTVRATDANGCTGTQTYLLNINTLPTISAVGVNRQQGSTASNSTIANVSDSDQALDTLSVTVNGGASASVNGVMVSGLSVSASGVVTAAVEASCPATNASFTLTVTDSAAATASATLSVSVAANGAPTLTYSNQSIAAGGALTITPATGPADNGTINTIAVLSASTYTGLISVNNSTGVVSISNAQPGGAHDITIRATDNCGAVTDAAFTLSINCPVITLNPPALSNGTLGVLYNQSVTAGGGAEPYTFSLSGGSLPGGLSLSSAGVLSGTPTAAGTFNFTLKATAANGCEGTRLYAVSINTPPAISALAASRQQGSAVSNSTIANLTDPEQALNTLTVTVNGGASATVNGVTVSGLLVSAGGVVTANIVANCSAANASFSLLVTDSSSATASTTLNVTVTANAPPALSYANQAGAAGGALSINPTSGPSDDGSINSITVQSTGTYTGTISVNNSTGVISLGNAQPSGTHTITIRATDNCGVTADATFTLTITCQTVTVNPASLPNGTLNHVYNQTVTADGGTAPYGFIVSSGSLPSGLSLSSAGVLSGTPTSAGAFAFTVQATEANGCLGSQPYTISINTLPAISAATVSRQQGSAASNSTIANVTDPDQALNTLTVTVNGGANATANGVTVSGLSLTAAGAVTADVVASCAASNASFTLTVTDNAAATATATFNVTVTNNSAPSLSYNNQTVAASGSLTINPVSGPADNGSISTIVVQSPGTYAGVITVNSTTGAISLSNAAPSGSHTITIRVTDNCGTFFDAAFTLTVSCTALTLSPAALPNGRRFIAYPAANFSASGGTGPYTFALTAGALPAGLSLLNGTLSGTPLAAGLFNVTITATDAAACTGSRSYMLTIQRGFVRADFDGDGRTDLSVWRGDNGNWLTLNSSNSVPQTVQWGAGYAPYFDEIVPGDYDGDGITDHAIWRGADSIWYVRKSSDGQPILKYFGANYAPYFDIPTPGDYDKDGKTDLAVWRPTNGTWYVWKSSDNSFIIQTWGAAGDTPVPGDYDGDGQTDFAIWRGSTGEWLINQSTNGPLTRLWGAGYAPYFDLPVPADYDGDGKTDLAIWRGQDSIWYIRKSSDGQPILQYWGANYAPYFDIPTPGDFDGDGKADIAVWRQIGGTWFVLRSSNGTFLIQSHGQNGDVPVPRR
jgi:hypothetical protein